MVHRAVSDARFLHAADHTFKGVDILAHVPIQLHIADVAGVGQGVERCFLANLLEGADGIIHRDVEGVGVIFPIGHPGNFPIFLLIDPHKGTGKTLGGSGQQSEVEPRLLGLVVHALAHIGDDLIAQLVAFFTLAVMLAGQGLQRFRQPDEAHGEGAVLQHFGYRIVAVQFFRINPNPLSHEEGVVVSFFAALDLEPVQELLDAQVDALIQNLVELLHIPLGLNTDPRQVDGGEAQVATSAGHFPLGIVDIAHHPGTAAHVGHFGVVISGLVILQIEGGVQEAEVGEQPLGAHPHGQLEQVVVGISFVVVDPFLHLEDLHRENGGFPVSQTGLCGQQQVPDHHPALFGGVGAIVQRAEGHLGTCPGIHGIQVVNQSLHGLIGGLVGLPPSRLGSILGRFQSLFFGDLLKAVLPLVTGQVLGELLPKLLDVVHGHPVPQVLFCSGHQGGGVLVGHVLGHLNILDQSLEEFLGIGLVHALSHGVIKNRHALATVHFVLVGLDGNAGQGRIATDIIGLPQIAVARGKAVVEQLDQIDLAAGFRQGVEILVVNVDIPFGVCLGNVGRDHVFVVKTLGALGAVFEHGAHGGIRIDVGVFPLQVHVLRRHKGQCRIDLHQLVVHFPELLMFRPVQDVGLGGFGVVRGNELFLHHVLDLFHRGDGFLLLQLVHHRLSQLFQLLFGQFFRGVANICLEDGAAYFRSVKGNFFPAALDDGFQHAVFSSFPVTLCLQKGPRPPPAVPGEDGFYYSPKRPGCQPEKTLDIVLFKKIFADIPQIYCPQPRFTVGLGATFFRFFLVFFSLPGNVPRRRWKVLPAERVPLGPGRPSSGPGRSCSWGRQ